MYSHKDYMFFVISYLVIQGETSVISLYQTLYNVSIMMFVAFWNIFISIIYNKPYYLYNDKIQTKLRNKLYRTDLNLLKSPCNGLYTNTSNFFSHSMQNDFEFYYRYKIKKTDSSISKPWHALELRFVENSGYTKMFVIVFSIIS